MVRARNVVAIVGVLTLGTGLWGCSSEPPARESAKPQGDLVNGATFTMALGTDPGTLDPHRTVLSAANSVGFFLYDALIRLDQDGAPVKQLAESWEADTTQASFTLREDLTCSDGSDVTATQVADNINFVADPENESPLLGLQVAPGTKATGDDAAGTVEVKSGAPDAFLLTNIGSLPIVCGEGLTDRKLLAKGGSGTGMYEMTEVVPNDRYTMTRRADYTWGQGDFDPEQDGLPDKVVFKVVPNETTAANLLLSGDLTVASVNGADQSRLDGQDLYVVEVLAPMGEFFFNHADAHATSEEDVRRALVQGLDLDEVGSVITDGKGKPSTGMVTIEPSVCGGDTVTGNLPEHDPDAAKAVLSGEKPTIKLIYSTQSGPGPATAAELIQQTWKDLGVEVSIKGLDSPGLNQVLFGSGDWDVALAPVGINLPSQMTAFVSGPGAPKGVNFSSIDNPTYDKLVKEAAQLPGEEGCDTWNEAETALITALDVLPFYNGVSPVFGKDVEFEMSTGSVVPTSIRMHG